jgi:hypothetical protein
VPLPAGEADARLTDASLRNETLHGHSDLFALTDVATVAMLNQLYKVRSFRHCFAMASTSAAFSCSVDVVLSPVADPLHRPT